MELKLTPGVTAFLINVITDVFAIVVGFCLVKSLNGYGRWKLYRKGRIDMNMHFHDTSVLAAVINVIHHKRGPRGVLVFLVMQAVVCVIVLILRTVAPIGVSESKDLRVEHNHIVRGQALCLEHGTGAVSGMIGMASERIIKHFRAGGKILRVGKTGRNHDALILQDKERSHGRTVSLEEWNMSTKFRISTAEFSYNVQMDYFSFFNEEKFPDTPFAKFTFSNVDYLEEGIQVTEGPLYIVVARFGLRIPERPSLKLERYAFSKCMPPRVQLELERNQFVDVTGNCTVATLERDATKSGRVASIDGNPAVLEALDSAFHGLNMSEMGQRAIMAYDLAGTLARSPCGDEYVAYLPLSEVSVASIAIISALGVIAVLFLVFTAVSFFLSWRTFNWNESYERVINLAANSDSIGLPSCTGIAEVAETDVVIENTSRHDEADEYVVHVIRRDTDSTSLRVVKRGNVALIR